MYNTPTEKLIQILNMYRVWYRYIYSEIWELAVSVLAF